MKERIEDILEEVLICAVLLALFSLAILVGIWEWLKGLFHKHEEEKDVADEFHGDIRERIWLISDHTFDIETTWPLDFR